MSKYFIIAMLVLTAVAFADPLLTSEEHFFGIPNVDSLSIDWFLDMSDTTDYGFFEPCDIEVLRLSPIDYRMVILDAVSKSVHL